MFCFSFATVHRSRLLELNLDINKRVDKEKIHKKQQKVLVVREFAVSLRAFCEIVTLGGVLNGAAE